MVANFAGKVVRNALLLSLALVFSVSSLYAATQPAAGATVSRVVKGKADYLPSVVYKGEFVSNALYYKHNSKQPWMRWSKSDDYKQDVVCQEALAKLASAGFWAGNIAPKGACGTSAEPATFMLGNYLNYSASN